MGSNIKMTHMGSYYTSKEMQNLIVNINISDIISPFFKPKILHYYQKIEICDFCLVLSRDSFLNARQARGNKLGWDIF